MPRDRARPGRATRLVPGAPVARLRVQVRGDRVPAPKRPLGVLAHVEFLQQKVSDVEKAYFIVGYTNWTETKKKKISILPSSALYNAFGPIAEREIRDGI